MSLEAKIMEALKEAMKSKDKVALESLRAVKSALLLEKTNASSSEITESDELKLLQKLVKQRKDSAKLFSDQGRSDLAEQELEQAKVIERFLPEQLSLEEVEQAVSAIIKDLGVSQISEMGKVMQKATQILSGKTDGKTISEVVKKILS